MSRSGSTSSTTGGATWLLGGLPPGEELGLGPLLAERSFVDAEFEQEAVGLTDGTAGLILEVTVSPTGPAILRILVTSLSDARDPDIEYEEKSNSPTQTYATATLSKVAVAKRPPNG